MGGTSTEVAVIDEELRYANVCHIGDFDISLPAVDLSSIGAGGGSIAWTDAAGILKVGPESAGSEPGPACYARGGTRPTITDAYVTMGIVDPERFLGGELKLRPDWRGVPSGASRRRSAWNTRPVPRRSCAWRPRTCTRNLCR